MKQAIDALKEVFSVKEKIKTSNGYLYFAEVSARFIEAHGEKILDHLQNPWKPMDQAPVAGRILLKYADGQVIGGQWETNRYASTPRPYWTNDFEYIRGKLWTRGEQPIGWMHFPDGKS